jgi:tetratricopeptide (TPR) repeat protein
MFRAILTLLLLWAVPISAQDALLKVGDPAPAMLSAKWMKGKPVEAIEPGRIYVIEFWSTWCPRSKEAIPQVSELQRKHPDVIFIGQSIWEQDQNQVEPFLKEMGDKISYRIATDDGEQGRMATSWMQAAGQDGVPTAFIIDKRSRIAWIGHPMEMDSVLDEVVKGTFDAQAAVDQAEKLDSLRDRLTNAMQNYDFDGALSVLDELDKLDPKHAADIDTVRFQVLLQKHDLDGAFKAARRLAGSQKNPDILNEVAWRLVDPASPVENPDLEAAEKCALRAVEASNGRRGEILDTLARVYFLQGKLDQAIEFQTKAVEHADQPELRRDLQKTLDDYKARK